MKHFESMKLQKPSLSITGVAIDSKGPAQVHSFDSNLGENNDENRSSGANVSGKDLEINQTRTLFSKSLFNFCYIKKM